MVQMEYPKVEFLGLDFHPLTPDAALEAVIRHSAGDAFSYVVTPNVAHIVSLHREPDGADGRALRSAYCRAALSLCDSRIVAALAKLTGLTLPVVTGSDLTAALVRSGFGGGRVALIGGSASQLQWLTDHRPDVEWLQHIPPMGLRSNPAAQEAAILFIEAAKAQFILFTVGAPQSELLAAEVSRRGRAGGVGLCVGASIEFVTGEKQRAPAMVSRLGMEWAFRLLAEPRRLWRRYLIEGPRIFEIWWQWRKQRRVH